MKKKMQLFALILLAPFLMGQGCSNIVSTGLGRGGSSTAKPSEGGIWYSETSGTSWEQRVALAEPIDGKTMIDKAIVSTLMFHPLDSRVLFANTNQGIYVSEDSTATWKRIFEGGLMNDIRPSPNERHTVYASMANKIIKTTDYGATWNDIYVESRPGVTIQQIAIDTLESTRVYAGNSMGELLVSQDAGESWQVLYEFKVSIARMLISPRNRNELYVATKNAGIWVSFDRGQNWTNTKDAMKDFPGAHDFRELVVDESRNSSLLYASAYGLLWTIDGGSSWSPVELITPPNSINIRALAVNPKNVNEIIFANESVMYHTLDGGAHWTSEKLPGVHLPNDIQIDFFDPKKMYMGVELQQQKKRKGLIGL